MITPETLQAWQSLAAQLASVKKLEMIARREIANEMLGPQTAGTKHGVYGETEAHASVTEKLAIDNVDVRAIMESLSPAERECIEWKPSLKVRDYKALPEDNQLKAIVKLTLNAPSVSINKLELL